MEKLTSNAFNMVEHNPNGEFVRIEELNKMIEYGAITIDPQKLREYKFDTTVIYDKEKFSKEEVMKFWPI